MAKSTAPRLDVVGRNPDLAARPVLQGDLRRVGLAAVLTMLEIERGTGALIVKRGRQSVRLEIFLGHVMRARVGGRGPSGAEAVFLALGWTSGDFQLFAVGVDAADEIGMRTTFLLMEAARRIDEPRGLSAAAS